MLKPLLKKQFAEIFRMYFYDQKKNKARSRGSIIGMFAMLSFSMCRGLAEADMIWLYFLIMGLLSVFLGVFGSVFNTYAGLYLAKDNDFLFSMPVPVRDILRARLLGVYLMGAMYSLLVVLPACVVYWITAPTAAGVVGSLILTALITVFVLVLSCALGWVVAKVSLRLKNKSFITVIVSLLFIAAYYALYFKASELIRDLIANAAVYGEKIKGAAYGLYLFGRVGEGDPIAIAVFIAAAAALAFLTFRILSRSFLKIVTATPASKKTVYKEKKERRRSSSGALLQKEAARFFSNANYMLNCGLGAIMLPLAGAALLWKGPYLIGMLDQVFGNLPNAATVLVCAMFCLISSMNDTAAPSVSLEAKQLWLMQSLPVSPRRILLAKLELQLLVTLLPMAPALVCAWIALGLSPLRGILVCAVCLSYGLLEAAFDLFLGVKMPNLTWTNEMVPIKQSGSVMIAVFSAWVAPLCIGGGYMLFASSLGDVPWLSAWLALFVVLSAILLRWILKRGARIFASL